MVKRSGNRDANKTIQVLFEISSALNSAPTLDELYKSIHKSLGRILNVDNIYISLYHEEKDSITFPYYMDEKDENHIEIFDISRKQSLTAKVINQKKALLATEDDLLKMASEGSGELVGTPCKVWIGAPLKIKDRAIGALALQSYTSQDTYNETDLDLLSYVSDFIAISIEQKQTETAQKESEDINRTLFEISRAINTTNNLSELFESIYSSLSRIIDVTNFYIGLYNKDTNKISFPFYIDAYDDLSVWDIAYLKTDSLTNEVFLALEPVFLNKDELKLRAEQNKIVGTTPLVWIGIPLLFHGSIKGVMVVQSYTDPDLYDLRDVEILSSVSEQIAMAIERKTSEEALKKSEAINKVLFAVSNAVNITSDLYELYKSIHKSLGTIIDLTNFIIGLHNKANDTILFEYYIDQFDDLHGMSLKLGEGSVGGEVIKSGRAVFLKKDALIEKNEELKPVGTWPKIWMGVPLKTDNKVIGYMATQSYTDPDLFDEGDLKVFLAVSDQVATAIELKRIEDAEKKSKAINHVMFAISNAVNTSDNLDELYKMIHETLGGIIDVTNFTIGIYDRKKDIITYPYYEDETGDEYSEIQNVSTSGIVASEVINLAKPFFINRNGIIERAAKMGIDVIGEAAEQWLGVPLKIKKEVIGVIVVQSYSDPELYSQKDVGILSAVSDQVAMAIDRKREEGARKKSEKINKTLFEIANAVNTTRNLKQLCKSIHQSLKKVIYVKNFSLSLYDKQADQLNFLYRDDETEPGDIIENVSQSTSLTYEVIRTGNPLLLDGQGQKTLVKKLGGDMIGVLAKSWLCIPLKVNNKVIGAILTQDYATEDCFNQKDIELLTLVSGQIALAIDRKRAEDAEKKSKEINRVLFAVSNAVNTTDNLHALYKSIHATLSIVIDVTNFMIGIYDHKKDNIFYPYFTDVRDDYCSEIQNVSTSGILASEIINCAKPFFITREEIIERAKRMGYRGLGVIPEQWFGVPLIIRKQVIGVLVVQSYTNPELYSQKDVGILMSVSDQVALAIDRKRYQEIILEREKQILQLSRQTQEFSLAATSIISMKDEKEIYKYISKAIVKHSDYNRLLISYFTDTPPYREIVRYEGILKEEIDRVRDKEAPREYYEKIFKAGTKIGNLSYYIPHTKKAVLGNDLTIFVKKESKNPSDAWHHEDTIYLRMNDADGNFVGVISVDDSKSGEKPTKETVRPLEIFSSLISQIMIFRKIQNELKDHKENLQKMVDDRTKKLTTEIVDRIQIEKKLKKAKIAAETAAKVKGEFLTNMSHEIRTPINGIMGMAEIAMDNDLDDELRNIIQTIDSEASSLLNIINQILDFSKIEADKLILEKIPFDLRNTFEKACFLSSMGIKDKGIKFISFLAPDVPLKLMGDPGRLRQIILNLAWNAMKFTHKGEILIKAEKVKTYKTGVEIKFIVKDTGIGIAKSKQKTIFDSFSQADGSTTRKYGGTGLGTTISKQLVELMGGEIGLESKVGKGSTFWFTIKFEQQKEEKLKKAETNINLKGLKILVADDSKTNRFVLIENLKAFGVEPVITGNSKKGFEIIKQSSVDKKPIDAVIINLKSLNIDGFEFATEIRQSQGFGKMPIIILASPGTVGDGQACKDIGIDAYLLKPVKQSELRKAIVTALYNFNFEKESNKLITRHTIAEELIHNPRVLVVEDYPTNQQITLKHLESAGYQAVLAKNGKVAVDLFKKRQFDVVMMDIQMPIMDGYRATQLIRQYESKVSHLKSRPDNINNTVKSRVPIIAMTAHAIKGYKEKCLEADMDDYISKPIRREKFLAMVGKWALKSQSDFDKNSIKKRAEKENNNHPEEMLSGGAPMNFAVALNEFEDDKEFLLEVVKEFIKSVEKQLPKIREAIAKNDVEALKKESHSIKGGAANLTAYGLYEIAHELEEISASDQSGVQDFERGSKVFANLEKEFLRLKSFMEKAKF